MVGFPTQGVAGKVDGEDITPSKVDVTANATETINVPSDESTLQDAVDAASERYRRRGTKVIVNIDSGHNPASGITITNGNFSFIEITSDDATVTVDGTWGASEDFLSADNCWMPTLSTTIDMNGNGSNGYDMEHACVGYITGSSGGASNGVQNAGSDGLVVRSSIVQAENCVFNGAGGNGLRCTQGGIAVVPEGNFSSSAIGIFVSRGAIVHAHPNVDCSSCTDHAIRNHRGFVNAQGATLTGATNDGVDLATGATAILRDADISGSGNNAITARFGCRVIATSADLSNDGNKPFDIREAGVMDLNGATITSANFRSQVSEQSRVNLSGADMSGLGDGTDVLELTEGSVVNVTGVTVDDTTGTKTITAGEINGLTSLNATESVGIAFEDS